MSEKILRLSWSSIQSFLECQRKYQLAYVEGLVKPDSAESGTPITGSHVHAGFEAALKHKFHYPNANTAALIREALFGIKQYRNDNLDPNKKYYNWDTGQYEPDADYFTMMDVAFDTARAVLEYQIPRFDWERYVPVSLIDLFGPERAQEIIPYSRSARHVDDPLIEWRFDFPFEYHLLRNEQPVVFSGVIDAVLFDRQMHEYIILDWKTRRSMVDETLVMLDGQLPTYAAVINQLAGEELIRRGVMYQINMDTPSPAKLTQKGEISKAVPGSTWEVWSSSVYALGFNPEHYREEMLPKMQPESRYTAPVEVSFNAEVDRLTLTNLAEAVNAIISARESENFPGVLSTTGCQFCVFKRLCYTYQGGGDPNVVINREFVIKREILENESA